MKKILFFAAVLLGALALTTSCNKKDNSPMEYSMLATIVDGSWSTGNYYAKFDNGEKAFVENSSANPISASIYLGGEARAVITFYYVEGVKKDGFDHVINVTNMYVVPNEYLKNMAFSGITDATKYDDAIAIDMGFVSSNFINVALRYRYSDLQKHDIKLIHNDTLREESVYKEFYENADEDCLYLELYHDNGDDKGQAEYSIYHCYKVTDIDLKDYKEIKILYKSMTDNKLTSFPIKL